MNDPQPDPDIPEPITSRQASDERYRTLFNYAPDGIIISNREGRYLDANLSVCRMLGYSHDELIGKSATDIVMPSEVDHVDPALATIHGPSAYRREWQFRRKDGSTFSADVMTTVMPDGNLLAMLRDLTARKQADQAIVIAEERMRFALEAAHIGFWDMDSKTGVVRWSREMEDQYGIPRGSFGGTFEAFVALLHPDDRASVLERIGKATDAGIDFTVQHRTIRPDGTVRSLAGAGRVLTDDAGEAIRAIGISQDVTERDALQARLHQSQKMDAIGRLAGGVAHDFNNLLTVILGFCEMLLEGQRQTGHDRTSIEQIQRAATRAAELTRQLLAFSRQEIIELKTLDVAAILDEMRPMLGRLIREDVHLVFGVRGPLAEITADRGQFEQVILNLAVNAQDAMPGGGTLTIEAGNAELDGTSSVPHFDAAPGRYVAITVKDSGKGMTAAVHDRLFEPFFTTKPPGEGTGLGLATVHGIVARAGGFVIVRSEPGRGTSFTVYFPQAASVEKAVEPPVPAAAPLTGTEVVLIVEDADILRDLTRRLLERRGYTVLVAASAVEAIHQFDEHPSIQLVLTDVVMPGMSGPALIQLLLERRPGLKVLYMSGYTDDAIVQHGVLKPGIAFLHKPFTANAIARKLRETLDRP